MTRKPTDTPQIIAEEALDAAQGGAARTKILKAPGDRVQKFEGGVVSAVTEINTTLDD
ncbi:MAG: hypothetical protein AAFR17_08850 [Pseudomonadota bacterium]